jgi:hypothetical protein
MGRGHSNRQEQKQRGLINQGKKAATQQDGDRGLSVSSRFSLVFLFPFFLFLSCFGSVSFLASLLGIWQQSKASAFCAQVAVTVLFFFFLSRFSVGSYVEDNDSGLSLVGNHESRRPG